MVKFVVYTGIEKKEQEVYLKLLVITGRLTLIAVDKAGKRLSQGSILEIRPDGMLHLCTGLSDRLGFKLKYRRIKHDAE